MLPLPALRFVSEDEAVLLEPYVWALDYPVTVPDGFRHDGATVPAPFWWPIGHPWALWLLQIAIPHDYELATGVEWFEAWRRMRARSLYVAPVWWKRWAVLAGVWLRGVWRKIRPPVRTHTRHA